MRIAIFAALMALGLVFWPSSATADIIGPQNPDEPTADSPWQAGTCKSDAGPCSVATPLQFYEQASGHPPVGFTQFIVNTETGPPLGPAPIGNLRTVRVDLPTGLTVNPQSSNEQCDLKPKESPAECATKAPGSKVGTSEVTATNPATGFSLTLPKADVYNVVPNEGEPARFGFSLLGNDVFLEADIAWENDYHEYFTIHVAKLSLPTIPLLGEAARIAKNRLVFDGTAGDDGTFITTPTTCFGEATPGSLFEHVYSTLLRADSYEEPNPAFPNGSAFVESKIPPKTSPKNCGSIPFDPSIGVEPNTTQTDSPAGATVTVNLPEVKNPLKDEKSQGSSQVRSARVTLPAGMGLNPSAANGLVACTDAQFGKGTRNPVACPAASRIGTVEVDTPPLPDGSLSGPVFVGQQLSRDPTSGEEYRIFVVPESTRYDISARLLGKISADPQTGQLTTTFDDKALGSIPIPGLPQVPFKSFRIKLNSGAKAPLTSPGSCGPHKTTTVMTPWSGNPAVTRSGDFSLSAAPGGGKCAKTLAERPFAPSFAAGTNKQTAGDFSPLHMDIARSDGNQELKGVDVTLPPGLSAKLAGVKYCPGNVLAAAAANSGSSEAADSSCPDSSLIGHADVAAGSGPSPIHISGKVFLSGRYEGAPLSLAVITPATAGPFDLGTVVVRVALFVDRRTAQVHAVSDPIPHVYGGATLDVRSVSVKLDRKDFSLNPTNCSPFAFSGSLLGGGANPTDPAAFAPTAVSAPFKADGCEKLGFKPKLFLRLFGASRRAKNPKLRAVLLAHAGDANIARAATILPRSLILDQGNLSKVCTRVQFAANDCPKNSIYGHARAFSPLLDKPLEGPVYLRSSNNVLPDLVSDLRGQVEIELDSRTDSVHGHIRNTFDLVPDVPVSKFVLTLRGGTKGLLVNSRNQCPRKHAHGSKGKGAQASKARGKKGKGQRAIVRFKAQNGKKINLKPRLRAPCGKKHKGAKKNK
ncbi:MAG TPA: hypothetical protein VK471_01495 [Solirubrobacterales bacterium]|nr:hypothetical protein [Solirubrobacterales bacterium]